MKINRQQEKALMTLFTVRSWPQRIMAILVLVGALFGWSQQDKWLNRNHQPGQISKGMKVEGKVVSVADGDTVTLVDREQHQYKLRLAYIDAPEKAMPYGQEAKRSLQQMLESQQITAEIDDVDRYGRGVARIFKQGKDINYTQLAKGYAWHYSQYARKSQSDQEFRQYQKAQEAAQNKHSGLWQQNAPRPPWEWRAEQRLEE